MRQCTKKDEKVIKINDSEGQIVFVFVGGGVYMGKFEEVWTEFLALHMMDGCDELKREKKKKGAGNKGER